MSKIEDYKKAKRIAENVERSINCALGKDRKDNDKHYIQISYNGKHTDSWSDAIMYLHASYGYYGCSSGYSAMNENVAKYMTKAINEYLISISNRAIELAKKDTEKARLEAENEAREVLQEIK